MSARGLDFLQNWIETNVTDALKESVDGDSALLTLELAERAIADAAKSGLRRAIWSLNSAHPRQSYVKCWSRVKERQAIKEGSHDELYNLAVANC